MKISKLIMPLMLMALALPTLAKERDRVRVDSALNGALKDRDQAVRGYQPSKGERADRNGFQDNRKINIDIGDEFSSGGSRNEASLGSSRAENDAMSFHSRESDAVTQNFDKEFSEIDKGFKPRRNR